jgi:hypothetical protein
MGRGPSDFDSVGSPYTAKAMRAQHASFLQDALKEFRRIVAAMHTIWEFRARMVCCVLHWLGGALLTDGDLPQIRLICRSSDDSFLLLT